MSLLKRLHQKRRARPPRGPRWRPWRTVALPPTKVSSSCWRSARRRRLDERYDDAVHGLLSALVTDRHHATKTIIERDWARAFERPLSVQPRGRKERRSLRATLGVLDAVASSLDPLDARWRDLAQSACEVVAPAGLVGESDGLPSSTCAFLATLCQKAPRFALDSNDAERLLIRLLDKGPSAQLNSQGHGRRGHGSDIIA